MRRPLCPWMAVFLLLLVLVPVLPGPARAEVLYLGEVTKDMTIRKTRSTSGTKLGKVTAGETVNIEEFGENWTKIDQNGTVGYILSKNVTNLSSARAFDDAAEAVCTGVATKTLTLRQKKSAKSFRLGEVAEGETVYITEPGRDWMAVVRNGIPGYVLSSGITITAVREGVQLPEEFQPEEVFQPYYTAQAMVNLSMRRRPDADAPQVGGVREDERVEVMEIDGDWARVRKNGTVGYVLSEHMRYYRRTDPFGPLIPGVTFLPYAAKATEDVEIVDRDSGEVLRTLHAGDVVGTTSLDLNMTVTLPYQRTWGRILATGSLEFEAVMPWEVAMPGDLIAVFSTFYAEEPSTEKEEGRLFNIEQGVERLQNVVIAAGGEFRFNDYCAPYTKGNGYELGPIINYVSDKKMGYGGGICQVSTTLYNAALQIPFEIVKQQVHSSYGIFYAPLDLDAAVGSGNLDLRLRNMLSYPVRLHLQTENGVLTIRIYRCEN